VLVLVDGDLGVLLDALAVDRVLVEEAGDLV